MPIISRRKFRGSMPRPIPHGMGLKTGLSLKGLLRSTPRYFINSGKDVEIIDYKDGLKTKTGLPAVKARAVADFTATDMPPTPHNVLVVGLMKGVPISQQKKVLVSCDCANYTFIWEYANTVNRASRIKYCNGEPAYTTNPGNRPGLCKHLVAFASEILENGD